MSKPSNGNAICWKRPKMLLSSVRAKLVPWVGSSIVPQLRVYLNMVPVQPVSPQVLTIQIHASIIPYSVGLTQLWSYLRPCVPRMRSALLKKQKKKKSKTTLSELRTSTRPLIMKKSKKSAALLPWVKSWLSATFRYSRKRWSRLRSKRDLRRLTQLGENSARIRTQ